VGPRLYLDEACALQHPPLSLPTGSSEASDSMALLNHGAGQRSARRRAAENLEWWTAREALSTEVLSSGCLFVSRSAIDEMGLLYDTSFQHGFEEADLCRRMAATGRWVVHLPKAEVILHGLSIDTVVESGELGPRYEASRRAYFQRYVPWYSRRLVSWLEKRAQARRTEAGGLLSLHPLGELGSHEWSFELDLPGTGEWQIEISNSPDWLHSVGCLAVSGRWRLPEAAWKRLEAGQHYLRVLDASTGKLACAYRFTKTSERNPYPVPFASPGSVLPGVRPHGAERLAG